MNANDKHLKRQLGIWTIVMNKPSLLPEWLPSIRTIGGRLWTGTRYMFATSEEAETSLEKDKDGAESTKLPIEIRTLAYLGTFVKEIYSLGPVYFILEFMMSVWHMASGALQLYYTTRLLSAISQCLENRQLETYHIAHALAGKILITVLAESLSKLAEKYSIVLRERVKYHFLEKTMHTELNLDMLTAEDPEVHNKVRKVTTNDLNVAECEAWDAFSDIMETFTDIFTIISELSLMLGMSRSSSTFTLSIAMCFVHPVMHLVRCTLYTRSFVAFNNNSNFARMASLHNLVLNDEFREDRITNNLGDYIEREFKSSKRALGDTDTSNVYRQWFRSRPIYSEIFSEFIRDSSLLFFALRVLWDFSNVSMGELILVQQTSRSVQMSSYRLLFNIKRISGHLFTIRNLYTLDDIQNKVKDGDTPYPLYSEENNSSAAEIEFRNVSFKYPGTEENALTDLSFTIKPGQLVVIVGVNGSGKSSTIKLLSRLYDPSAGEILLDGRPISSYKLTDIRRAMAVLRQDHPVLPLSLRENVALGLVERNAADGEVEEAIQQGGAEKLVSKLKQGLETVLDPVETVKTNFVGDTDPALKSIVEEKEVKTDLSGGETQRLSASRTFMRLMGGSVRLVVADEPTSALDPEGEYELFRRLREHSGGKTVIFITHRFGHLTKFADLILCLQDGVLTQQGTHEELIGQEGEYKKLYDLQAKAFVSEVE